MPHCCVGADVTLGCTVTTVKRTRVTQEFFYGVRAHGNVGLRVPTLFGAAVYKDTQQIEYSVMHNDSLSLE